MVYPHNQDDVRQSTDAAASLGSVDICAFPDLMGYLAEGKIRPVIARRMPLVEAQQAQELLLGAKMKGKIVLICN